MRIDRKELTKTKGVGLRFETVSVDVLAQKDQIEKYITEIAVEKIEQREINDEKT